MAKYWWESDNVREKINWDAITERLNQRPPLTILAEACVAASQIIGKEGPYHERIDSLSAWGAALFGWLKNAEIQIIPNPVGAPKISVSHGGGSYCDTVGETTLAVFYSPDWVPHACDANWNDMRNCIRRLTVTVNLLELLDPEADDDAIMADPIMAMTWGVLYPLITDEANYYYKQSYLLPHGNIEEDDDAVRPAKLTNTKKTATSRPAKKAPAKKGTQQ